MLLEIGLIAGGVPAGWLLRKNEVLVRAVNCFLGWIVRVMLFLLGMALGSTTRSSASSKASACSRRSSAPFPCSDVLSRRDF